jgi:hypothetical protein
MADNSEFNMSSLMKSRKNGSSIRGVALLAACTVSLATMMASPAYADHDNDRGERGERGEHQRSDRGHERHHSGHHHYQVYAPGPVYYPRQESPGISLFIPLWDR